MDDEPLEIGYDDFFPKPLKERLKIFSEISAENRAYLVRTQAERWLTVNRSNLTSEQVGALEEAIKQVSSEWYYDRLNARMATPRPEALAKKLEALFRRDDLRQIATERADYIAIERNG